MPHECLPKKIFYGELQVGNCSQGDHKKRYKDILKASLKDSKMEQVLGRDCTLRKHAYSNILKISPPKTETFQIKIYFSYFCSKHRLWDSLEPPRRYYIKVGFKGSKLYRYVFVMNPTSKTLVWPKSWEETEHDGAKWRYLFKKEPMNTKQRESTKVRRLFKYIENITTKTLKISDKNSDIFFIFLLKT